LRNLLQHEHIDSCVSLHHDIVSLLLICRTSIWPQIIKTKRNQFIFQFHSILRNVFGMVYVSHFLYSLE